MGNSQTKEQKPSQSRVRSGDTGQPALHTDSGPSSPSFQHSSEQRNPTHPVYNVRTGRGSRTDLSTLLGIRSGPPSESFNPEHRRASKQEREARKLEIERAAREKERERSMREEHVDGGYLVTQGVYTGVEDYNKGIVRQLMVERRLAPFWRGLNEHSDSWTENQLVAAARGQPIPAADAIPIDEVSKSTPVIERVETAKSETGLNNLTIPITSRSQSFQSDTSSNMSPTQSSFPPGANGIPPPPSGSNILRGRAKTLASLTTSSKNSPAEIMPREMHLPKDPLVNGQSIEAYLYKDASECPICFLCYPPYLNKTRCCDQAICSECFVQIKRPDPHPPEHADPTAPPPLPTTEATDPEELISEPAACPFCVQPEFGITYDPPPFRRGLTYVNHVSTHPVASQSSAMSSASSLGSAISGRLSPTGSSRRRATSISANSPSVITTDRVRPDWHQKLASARAHTARRSAAATALHTAAYLMGNQSEGRLPGPFGRRGILRRTSGPDNGLPTNPTQLSMLAMMSERYTASHAARGEEGEPSMVPGLRGSSRRNRVDDLEDMMMMEAIRLSLASEEDRRKKEEKESKKDAKKKEKEHKKAEKAARKAGVYPSSVNQSSSRLANPFDDANASQIDFPQHNGKGKAVQQSSPERAPDAGSSSAPDPQEHLERARAQILPTEGVSSLPYASSPYRPSHLRNLSNASSTTSSLEGGSAPGSLRTENYGQGSSLDVSPSASGINISASVSAQDTYISGTPPGGGAGMEPMFNFRSLAAMVGDDENSKETVYEESADGDIQGRQRGESSASATVDSKFGDDVSRAEDEPAPFVDSHPDIPGLKITPASRMGSDLEKAASEDTKHAAFGVENVSHENAAQTSS